MLVGNKPSAPAHTGMLGHQRPAPKGPWPGKVLALIGEVKGRLAYTYFNWRHAGLAQLLSSAHCACSTLVTVLVHSCMSMVVPAASLLQARHLE